MEKKDLNKEKQRNQLTFSEIIRKPFSIISMFTSALSGCFLLWIFFLSIGRPELFQLIISDSLSPIIISIAVFVYMAIILYIFFFQVQIFKLNLLIFSNSKNISESLPIKRLIIYNLILSIGFQISIVTLSYFSFWNKINITFLAFIIYIILLLIVILLPTKEKTDFLTYQKLSNNKKFKKKYIIKRKLIFISIIVPPSLYCFMPIKLILVFIDNANSELSCFILNLLCIISSILNCMVILYIAYRKNIKNQLISITYLFFIVTILVYSFIPNIFYKAFEKVNIIDSSDYDLIFNKKDYPLDVFNDNQWLIIASSEDENVYHVKGEKLFNLSKNVLFCPSGTYNSLNQRAIYNMDALKLNISKEELKYKVNKCVLLDANKVVFHNLLSGNSNQNKENINFNKESINGNFNIKLAIKKPTISKF